nr:MAK10-like protein [Tanacetum cinerariifolium]
MRILFVLLETTPNIATRGYRNTIELPLGNNVVPIRSDTIRLVQNGCSFHELRSEDPNQHLKDFLKLVDLLDLDARYEDEGWNGLVAPGEGSLDYENPDIKQLLGVMKCKVDTLVKEASSLMKRSESIFGMASNTVYQLPSEPSRQEEFENLVMNFILDQEEKVKQLKEYMGVIESDFMQLSLEVVGKLNKEIRMEKNRVKKIEKVTRNNQNIKSRHDPDPQSTPQVHPSCEENTPPMTYPDEVEEIIEILIEVEHLNETPLEDLGLNTCNYDIPLSSREIPNFDEPEPQPQPLPNYPPLDNIEDNVQLKCRGNKP